VSRSQGHNGRAVAFAPPGAHIDLHLRDGAVRQYSIWNGSNQTDTIVIAVKREAKSRGAQAVHRLKIGDEIAVAELRNNFPLDSGVPLISLNSSRQ
jgi:ferredoxin-NADP reductase